MEFKRILSWKYPYRLKEFKDSASIDQFINAEFNTFQKSPWYEKSTANPQKVPSVLEEGFNRLYSSIIQSSNWYKFQQNLSHELWAAISLVRN